VRAMRRGAWSPSLEVREQVFEGSGTAAADANVGAAVTCLYIADHYGDAALRRLVDRAADPAATTAADSERRALAAVLHTDRRRLAAAVQGWARRAAR